MSEMPNPFEFVYNAQKSVVQTGPAKIPTSLKVGDLVTYYDRNTINPFSGEVLRALCYVAAVTQDHVGYGIKFYILKCYDDTYNTLEDPTVLPGKFMGIVSFLETNKFVPWKPAEDDYDKLIGYEQFCTVMQNMNQNSEQSIE